MQSYFHLISAEPSAPAGHIVNKPFMILLLVCVPRSFYKPIAYEMTDNKLGPQTHWHRKFGLNATAPHAHEY